jgi:predicted outer membrane protein
MNTFIYGLLHGVAAMVLLPFHCLANQTTNLPAAEPALSAQSEQLTAESFVSLAMWSAQREIHLGQHALRVATDRLVRRYAGQLVRDHTVANERLRQLATLANIPLAAPDDFSLISPSGATGTGGQKRTDGVIAIEQGVGTRPARDVRAGGQGDWPLVEPDLEDVRRLFTLSGAAFEHAYIGQTVRDHFHAVRLFERATRLEQADLSRYAQETLPLLRQHYERGMRLASRTGGLQKDLADPPPERRR